MRPLKSVFYALCLVLLASLAFGQDASIGITYTPFFFPDNPPLGAPCDIATRVAFEPGVPICVFWDRDGDGPDAEDAQPAVGTGYAEVNWNCFGMTGEEAGGPGYFLTPSDLHFFAAPTAPDCAYFYMRINSGNVCWTSSIFIASPGTQTIDWADTNWTCQSGPCPSNLPTPNAPTNFQASVDTTCMEIYVQWQHDGLNESGFNIYEGTQFITAVGSDQRNVYFLVTDDADHTYHVTAFNAAHESAASNTAIGSTYLIRLVDGANGDITGSNQRNTTHSLHMIQPGVRPCEATTRFFLLRDTSATHIGQYAREGGALASDSLSHMVNVHLPNLDERRNRVLLEATSWAYGVTFTDTTPSIFDLGPPDATDNTDVLLPDHYGLAQNFPNPFNPETNIRFSVPAQTDLKISVYNVMGQLVRTLTNASYPAGIHSITWDGRSDAGVSVGAGVYLYRLESPNFTKTHKMLLLK